MTTPSGMARRRCNTRTGNVTHSGFQDAYGGPFKSLRLVARADPQQIIDNLQMVSEIAAASLMSVHYLIAHKAML